MQGICSRPHVQGDARGLTVEFTDERLEIAVREGGPLPTEVARSILQHAAERHADLLVIGTRDRESPGERVLGSVSSPVVQDAPIPVLLVPASVWRPAMDEPALPRAG